MTSAITIGIRILEALFYAGSIGSMIVVLLSLIDFVRAYIARDEEVSQPPPESHQSGQPQGTQA
jgi:hypothetical protein